MRQKASEALYPKSSDLIRIFRLLPWTTSEAHAGYVIATVRLTLANGALLFRRNAFPLAAYRPLLLGVPIDGPQKEVITSRMATPARHRLDGMWRVVDGVLISALAALIGAVIIMASVPPVSRDALTHLLAIPNLFLQHGLLTAFPDIPFSYYPMNLDLLYLIPLAFGSDILPKYIHLLFGVLTAGLIYHNLKMRAGRLWGLGGALLWLSTPMMARLSSEVYVDLGLGFFSMASLCALLRWSETRRDKHGLILAGGWCGLALGTKYNALLVLAAAVLAMFGLNADYIMKRY